MGTINLPADEVSEQCNLLDRHLIEIFVHDRAYLDASNPKTRIEAELEVISEVVLAPGSEETVAPTSPAMESALQKIAEGMRFELEVEGGQRLRCKLATILSDGKRFIFVNRKP